MNKIEPVYLNKRFGNAVAESAITFPKANHQHRKPEAAGGLLKSKSVHELQMSLLTASWHFAANKSSAWNGPQGTSLTFLLRMKCLIKISVNVAFAACLMSKLIARVISTQWKWNKMNEINKNLPRFYSFPKEKNKNLPNQASPMASEDGRWCQLY